MRAIKRLYRNHKYAVPMAIADLFLLVFAIIGIVSFIMWLVK